jgi:hypothetical protein
LKSGSEFRFGQVALNHDRHAFNDTQEWDDQPATKDACRNWGALSGLERVQEVIRDSKTEIQRVLDVYTKASEARLRTLERIEYIESRMGAVEHKLMLRLPAASPATSSKTRPRPTSSPE